MGTPQVTCLRSYLPRVYGGGTPNNASISSMKMIEGARSSYNQDSLLLSHAVSLNISSNL
eukprot:360896-Amphidinium_carterae.1